MNKVFNNNFLSLSLTSNLHLKVLRILAFPYIAFYRLRSYITCCSNIITWWPKFASAFISRKFRIFHQQPSRRNPFKKFCYIREFALWWYRKKNMDMLRHNFTAQSLPPLLLANFIKNTFKRPLYFTRQNSLFIFSNPYYVIGNFVVGILSFAR